MTTHDSDMVRLHMLSGTHTVPVKELGLEWPPPERLCVTETGVRAARDGDPEALVLVRVSYSQLDDETAAHPNIARGAEYQYATTKGAKPA